MKRNVFVLFVTLLLTLNTLLVIVPQDNIVKADATPPIPEIDTDLIYNITTYLCHIINTSYGEGELAKGRAFGTKGEHKAADKIADEMEKLDLYDPTTTTYPAKSYREQMESNDSSYFQGDLVAKLETLYQNLSINHSGTTTDLVDFYIHPRWNYTLFNLLKIYNYNTSLLTNNFSHTELRVEKRPKTPWLDYSICDLINDTLNDLEDDEIRKNLTLNDFDAFFNAVCKKIESTYNFTFSDIIENPENAKDLPWYNDTYWNETGDFVFIDEDPFFNPNAYLPPAVETLNNLLPLGDLAHWFHKLKIFFQMINWSVCNNNSEESYCQGLILYDFNNNTYNMQPILSLSCLPILFINKSIGEDMYENPNDYTINYTIDQHYNDSAVSYNVIGQINGTSNETVIISSYIDSWWCQGMVDGCPSHGNRTCLGKIYEGTER